MGYVAPVMGPDVRDDTSMTVAGQPAGQESPAGLGPSLEPIRPGGGRRPMLVAIAIVAVLVALVWQPWGRSSAPTAPSPVPRTQPAIVAGSLASPVSSTSPASPSRPSTGLPGPAAYVSLVDNEWTVVALLAPGVPASTEEPSIQHGTATTWPPTGPLTVLQQGSAASVTPISGPDAPSLACHGTGPTRDRIAVHLPADRVAYLGVTFPGMDPQADVTATILEGAGAGLRRVPPPVVLLDGMTQGRPYTVPSTGRGGTVLFAMVTPGDLPSATYQFAVATPGVVGRHYLYACVGT